MDLWPKGTLPMLLKLHQSPAVNYYVLRWLAKHQFRGGTWMDFLVGYLRVVSLAPNAKSNLIESLCLATWSSLALVIAHTFIAARMRGWTCCGLTSTHVHALTMKMIRSRGDRTGNHIYQLATPCQRAYTGARRCPWYHLGMGASSYKVRVFTHFSTCANYAAN